MRQASLDEITSVVQNLLALVPGRSFTRMVNGADSPSKSPTPQDNELPAIILNFYEKSKDSLEALQPPFGGRQIGELLLRQAHSLVLSALDSGIQLKERLNLLISLLEKVPKSRILDGEELFQEIHRQLRTAKSTSDTLAFSTVSCITSSITTLYTVRAPGLYINYDQICALVPLLVFHLWEYLSPLSIKFHVEAVRCLWQLHSISWQDHLVEASIASLMVGPSSLNSSHVTTKPHIERFFLLWGHINQVNLDYTLFRAVGAQASKSGAAEEAKTIYLSSLLDRPLFIVLDQLSLGPDSGSSTVKEWLQDRSSVYRLDSFLPQRSNVPRTNR
jgi:serine/threonine protein kinase